MRLKSLYSVAWLSLVTVALLSGMVVPLQGGEAKPIRALLVIGGCCHDYRQQKKLLTEGISARANVEWTIVHEGDGTTTHRMSLYEDPDWYKGYDVVVHDECFSDVKDKDFVEGILKPHRAGLPAVNLHCAMHSYRVSFDEFKDWFEFTGLDTRWHGAQLPIAINFVDQEHPITKGMQNWTTVPEELYNNMQIWRTVKPLAYGQQGNDKYMVAWVNDYHGTRVFSTTLGHNNETVNDARYLDLITRGLLWSVNKLNADYMKPAKRVLAPVKPGKKVLVPENLALNKPVKASASQNGHEPAHAVDGEMDTRWCGPDNGNGYWLQVDLQKPEEITGCKIVWERGGPAYQYKVEGSADEKTWKTLVEEKGSEGRPESDVQKFQASDVRYVRITVTKAPEGAWASFWEFEVFGKKMVEKASNQLFDSRLSGIKVTAGFEKNIFAGPPDISYPTCVAATPSGEVFVGVDQNGSLDVQPNRGWVVRCQDTDGDGVADKFNVFAKMDSPRGIVFDHNTLYVMHPPVLEAFYDENGDGVADRSEVLVSGLGNDLKFRGADHTCNGVRMGIDGWLYIALGDYGARKAVGKDGTELQVHGGGIVRVRPDGSELELVAEGTRNIYDVAIDPLMNIFTCDNTNDGDDWNVRLSHMVQTANYGYPRLFKHFADEIMPTMVDYGGGSPTGALFVDEPGLTEGLFTCQWGWNNVTRHPLKANGATFTAERENFVELPRPTGIDSDGEGNLYLASWKGATFNFNGPDVGFILRVNKTGYKSAPFPDLQKASEVQLVQYLASPSAAWRFHVQREILRRMDKKVLSRELEKLAISKESLQVRVAAIYTLKQLLGLDAQAVLMKIAKDASVREFALRALTDRKKEAATVTTKYLVDALKDENPRVRLQAVIALNRLNRPETGEQIMPLVAESDLAISHAAFRALVSLHASEVCFKVLDQRDSVLVPGAMRALKNMHDEKVVDGLIQRLSRNEGALHEAILTALCRLYYRESAWDGSWWGTRPDTTGPHFKWSTWEQSEKIGNVLRKGLANADVGSLRFLLTQFKAHKIDFSDLAPILVKVANQKPQLHSAVIDLLTQKNVYDQETISFLQTVAMDSKEQFSVRSSAFKGLDHAGEQTAALNAVVNILTVYSTRKAENSDDAFKGLRETFIRDGRHAKKVEYFATLAGAQDGAEAELAYAVLLHIAGNEKGPKAAKASAQAVIDTAWNSSKLPVLLRAIGDSGSTSYAEKVRSYLTDANPETAAAAKYACERLSGHPVVSPKDEKGMIARISYEDVVQRAMKAKGDAKLGAQLFQTVGCVKCHTTLKSEPLKGPFLGDITTRYSRAELIESILRPNAQIAQGFVTTTVQMKDESEYEGFIVRESGDELEIRNIAGATIIPKKDIVKRGTRTTSIMPEGLFDQLTPEDLASLLAYLQSLNAKS
jgi:putative membrane-bound dehydrogenase-like protein